MKKNWLLFCALMLGCAFVLASCGNKGNESESKNPNTNSGDAVGTMYAITYDLQGGSWREGKVVLEELGEQFIADYAANGGKIKSASQLDTGNLESGEFADIYSNASMKAKWGWLYEAIWEADGKNEKLDPKSADLKSTEVKSFYLPQLCGFFTGTKHTDKNFKTESMDFTNSALVNSILEKGTFEGKGGPVPGYISGHTLTLGEPVRKGFIFKGWLLNGKTVTEIGPDVRGSITLIATWQEDPKDVVFSSFPSKGLGLNNSFQLTWTVYPEDTYDKTVQFESMDNKILSVTPDGLVSALASGSGKVRVKLAANPEFEKTLEIKVINGGFFEASYATNSYTVVGEDIALNCGYYDLDGLTHAVEWKSETPSVASVDAKGVVHPLKTGLATLRATYGEKKLDFVVTVLDKKNISDELKFVLDSHNSNALTVYNLGIGAGTPAYYYDVVGGVSDLIFDKLTVDRTYYDKLKSGVTNFGPMPSIEFVCVHYTGNMGSGADADNNAAYFNRTSVETSIHYVTGRSNLSQYGSGYSENSYAAFAVLNEKYGAWHASTGSSVVTWDKTGVKVKDTDPEKPVITVSDDLYYVINGQKSQIMIPEVPEGYTVKDNMVTGGGKTATAINIMGLATKIEDGEYLLAGTWWGKQRAPIALTSNGGNMNSIGIESCVDIGSDLMHTWHVTAQLVADILVRYNLGFDRVVGHHFFSGKDCPQPLIADDMVLWNEFMEMVKAEYRRITEFKDAEISAKAVSGKNLLSDKGLLKQNGEANIVTYEVTIKKNGKTEKVTLATAVESSACCECSRTQPSLQQQNYTIK